MNQSLNVWSIWGRFYGYPECCVEAFCKGEQVFSTQWSGTGFLCCDSCLSVTYNDMVDKINSRRIAINPFPDAASSRKAFKKELEHILTLCNQEEESMLRDAYREYFH